MKTPHKHAALIKQWADGAQIQWYDNVADKWETTGFHAPCWDKTTQYRVKPEPDVVKYGKLVPDPEKEFTYNIVGCTGKNDREFDNIMFVFDGETGALKDCQVLAKE